MLTCSLSCKEEKQQRAESGFLAALSLHAIRKGRGEEDKRAQAVSSGRGHSPSSAVPSCISSYPQPCTPSWARCHLSLL